MASAEILLTDTKAKLVGEEFKGFKAMTEMINVSRLYNSIAALSTSRRALVEAYQFLKDRITFGKRAIEHSLIRVKLEELGSLNVANFYLTWRAIEALDNAQNGDKQEADLLRLLTPMVKKWSADKGVYITREAMELMGGMGYIEDNIMPKLMRDIMVLPIWEGAGNIMILDMLRASFKSEGFTLMCKEIRVKSGQSIHFPWVNSQLHEVEKIFEELKLLESDEMEATAQQLFKRLTTLFQMAQLIVMRDGESKDWIDISLSFLKQRSSNNPLKKAQPKSVQEINQLMGWIH
jgi:hypothetical protein